MQGKRSKKKKSPLIPILVIICLIVIAIILIKASKKANYDGNSLLGTFYYEEGETRYTFKPDGTGAMSGASFRYDYTYEADGKSIKIDFVKENVHDVVYSYELKDGVLTLVSKEGTISLDEKYILKKENK